MRPCQANLLRCHARCEPTASAAGTHLRSLVRQQGVLRRLLAVRARLKLSQVAVVVALSHEAVWHPLQVALVKS
jgi:hypothetical protein